MYIYIYILERRAGAQVPALLDPSDPSEAKALGPPISDFGHPISASGPQPSALRFPNSDLRFRPLDLSPHPPPGE